MKRLLILVVLSVCSASVHAQLQNLYKNKSIEAYKKRTGKDIVFQAPKNLIIALDSIPKANKNVLLLNSTGVYRGNNGNSADIYAYSPDNMPVLQPDPTFKSNMPVAGSMRVLAKPEENPTP